MQIRDSVIVVTGASSGIGRETALHLARKGALVWAVARSEAALKELAGEADGITPFVADVSSDADRAALVSAVGVADVLVNNAGIGWTGLVETMPQDQVRKLFEINVLGLIDLTQRFLPSMLERRHGHIVNVASVGSWVATPPITVYSASKFAVQGFSEGLRRELNGRGVAVTTVNPGPVATRFGPRAGQDDAAVETTTMGDESMLGVPVSMAAAAIVRSIQMGGMPGWATIAVPRVLGLSRLGAVPGLQLVVDAAALVARQLPQYRRSS